VTILCREYRGACYFIYDPDDTLRYVGSACSGTLGNRIFHTDHRDYIESVDVVMFDRRWGHYSFAFEALVVSRLQPPKNQQFKKLRIEPFPPWEQYWSKL